MALGRIGSITRHTNSPLSVAYRALPLMIMSPRLTYQKLNKAILRLYGTFLPVDDDTNVEITGSEISTMKTSVSSNSKHRKNSIDTQ
ncbi:MAG: hypothetical protein ACI9KN_002102 [Gammaproteobacteria bacterium]|jgi:hypothetical protein